MSCWADCPSDIRMMTEAMPMTMPSIVRMERILRCTRLRVAVLMASLKSMVRFLFKCPVAVVAPRSYQSIALHHPVFYPYDPIGKFSRLRFVCDQDNRATLLIEFLEYFHDLKA